MADAHRFMDRYDELTAICEELAADIRAFAGDPVLAREVIATFEAVNAKRMQLGEMLGLKPAGL